MTTITTRAGKGSALTNNELDANFTNLNAEVTPSRATVRPSLLLDFAQTKQLDPRITFSRASTASYYDGKSVVKAEENLLTYSQDFDNAAWNKQNITVTANAGVAPDGTSTADLVYATTSGTYRSIGQLFSTAANSVTTVSMYLKSNGGQWVTVCTMGGANAGAYFDLVNGVAGSYISGMSVNIASVGNGWYRCVVTHPVSSGSTGYIYITLAEVNGGFTTPTSGSGGFYVWGWQAEQRAYATAYTPTTSSAITNYIPVLQTAASGTARFDHDPVTGESKGLLIEEQRTNLVGASANYDFPAWVKSGCTVATGATASPDGTISGILVTALADQAGPRQDINALSGTTYTSSVYIKAGTCTSLYFRDDVGAGRHLQINPATGQITATSGTLTGYGSVAVGNGWYRYYMTYAADQNSARHWVRSNSGAGTFYIWGAQLEAGAFATSYIPTQITYTGRASTATYKAADGLIRIAGNDVARYEPNAAGGSNLLLEGARSNYVTTSDGLWSTTSINAAFSYNAGLSPDGAYSATKMTATGSGTSLLEKGCVVTASSTNDYYVSLYVKPINTDAVTFNCYYPGNGEDNVDFIFSTKTVNYVPYSGEYIFDYVGGGWYRIGYRITRDATGTRTSLLFRLWNRNRGASVIGDAVYFWGAQCELGSTPTSYIPSVETHTGRSSTATYYDSTGTIRTAASGQPRYTYNPSLLTAPPKLLLEAQATNLTTYSTTLVGFNYSAGIATTANSATAPDGTNTANLWKFTASTGTTQVEQNIPVTSPATRTFSVYVKTAGQQYLSMGFHDIQSGEVYANFDLVNGYITATPGTTSQWVGTSAQIISVGNGWYRCSITATQTSSTSWYNKLYVSQSATLQYTNGLGNSANAIYVWGAQVETGYAATSYIPTTSATVTRAADTATSAAGSRAADVYSSSQVTRSVDFAGMFGSNFSSWYNNKEWSVYTESAIPYGMGMGTTANFQPNSAQVGLYGGSTSITAYREGRVSGASAGVVSISNTGFNKTASAFVASTATAYGSANGSSVTSASVLNMENTSIYFGYGLNGPTWALNGWIKRFAYYPKRLSNAELQGITS